MTRRIELKTIRTENGCEEVVSHKLNQNGYAIVCRVQFGKKVSFAHRFVYAEKYGEISPGTVIRHKCDNPKCINIEHLEPGTQADNVADRDKRGRTSRIARFYNCKLSKEIAEFIKITELSGITQKEFAKMMGTSQPNVSRIKLGNSWGHIKSIKQITGKKTKRSIYTNSGLNNGNGSISDDIVLFIRSLELDGISQFEAAKMLGISQSTFSSIVSYRTRKTVGGILNGENLLTT